MIKEFEYNSKAMGTDCSIVVVCDSKELADNMYEIAQKYIEEYEECFSRFLGASELSILNEKKDMIVSKKFFDVTSKAYQLFAITKGIFNPLVQVERFGYNKNFSEIENNLNIKEEGLYDIDFSSVIIDKENLRVHLNDGQKLDYGGFLKGYLVEIIAKKIKSYSPYIIGVIVNLGGDINTEGLDANGNKFVFSIYNPVLKNQDVMVTLFNQSLATSGTYKRSWLSSNKKRHHILDISGLKNPDSDIVSASVISDDGAMSEAFTKVFLSIDYHDALKLIVDKKISFVIIKNDGQVIKSTI